MLSAMKIVSPGCLALLASLYMGCAAPAAAPISSIPLSLPAATQSGPDLEVKVVLDAPHLKIVSITLRRGTALPEHTAPVPVIIQAASGAGTAVLGDQRLPLDSAHAVSLAPDAPHAVEPEPGTDMTLLVFHLRGGGSR